MNYFILIVFFLYKLTASFPIQSLKCRHPPLKQLINQYSKAYVQQLDLTSRNLENNVIFDKIFTDHSMQSIKTSDNVGCRYTIKSVYRQKKFPYCVKHATLVDNNPIAIGLLSFKCEPISYLQPTLVQTNQCENGFYKFNLQFESIQIGFKLVLV